MGRPEPSSRRGGAQRRRLGGKRFQNRSPAETRENRKSIPKPQKRSKTAKKKGE